jgi:hypothetical protein
LIYLSRIVIGELAGINLSYIVALLVVCRYDTCSPSSFYLSSIAPIALDLRKGKGLVDTLIFYSIYIIFHILFLRGGIFSTERALGFLGSQEKEPLRFLAPVAHTSRISSD